MKILLLLFIIPVENNWTVRENSRFTSKHVGPSMISFSSDILPLEMACFNLKNLFHIIFRSNILVFSILGKQQFYKNFTKQILCRIRKYKSTRISVTRLDSKIMPIVHKARHRRNLWATEHILSNFTRSRYGFLGDERTAEFLIWLQHGPESVFGSTPSTTSVTRTGIFSGIRLCQR